METLLRKEAIDFVVALYDVTRTEAVELYNDEVEAYINLIERMRNEAQLPS